MRSLLLILIGSFFLSPPVAANSKTTLPDELVLSGDNVIAVEINGQPFQMEVRPEAAEAPMLNPEVAQALQLKPGMFGFVTLVGPEKVSGVSAVHKVDYGAGEQKQRIFWASRASSTVANGTISPASLPYKRVKFLLGQATAQEIIYRLPMDNFGFLGRYGMGTTVKAADQKIMFQFSLERPETLVSAPTGNWLAENFGGTLSGPPKSTLIYYGIERPTRSMVLATEIPVGDFRLSNVDVRVTDYGNASGIAEQGIQADDTQEIIVTGKRDKDIDLRIVAGRGFLSGCSSLLYDLEKREIAVSCAVK